jgi:hypothetical protein
VFRDREQFPFSFSRAWQDFWILWIFFRTRILNRPLCLTKNSGTDLYFSRHDGQAVTIEDFLASLEDANNDPETPKNSEHPGRKKKSVDLSQFKLWYSQAGTPLLKVKGTFNPSASSYALEVEQSCPPTPGIFFPEISPLPKRTFPFSLFRQRDFNSIFYYLSPKPFFSPPVKLQISEEDIPFFFTLLRKSGPNFIFLNFFRPK